MVSHHSTCDGQWLTIDYILPLRGFKATVAYLSKYQLSFPQQSKKKNSGWKITEKGTENKSENNFVVLTVAGKYNLEYYA